jgi:hypothetical protein
MGQKMFLLKLYPSPDIEMKKGLKMYINFKKTIHTIEVFGTFPIKHLYPEVIKNLLSIW